MRPLPRYDYSFRLPGVRLYREDLDELLQVMRDRGLDPIIADWTHRFDSVDEIQEFRGTHPKYLRIAARTSDERDLRISIEVKRTEVAVSAWGDKDTAVVSADLRTFLEDRQAYVQRFPFMIVLALMIVVLALTAMIHFWGLQGPAGFYGFGAAGFVGGAIFVLTSGGVVLRRRHAGGFLKAHAHEIAIAVISAIIGAVVAKVL